LGEAVKYWLFFLLAFVITALAGESRAQELPREWHGTWAGELKIWSPTKPLQKIPMTIVVVPLDAGKVQWRMVYDPDGKKLVKDYVLKPAPGGKLVMDEKNGIELPGRLLDDTLYFQFKVDNTLLDTRYRLSGETLTMELTTCDPNKTKPTGPSQAKVSVLDLGSMQKAVLRKISSP